MSGATIVLISRRNMSLKTRRLTAIAGASKPSSAPRHHGDEDPSGERTAPPRKDRQKADSEPAQRDSQVMEERLGNQS